MAQQNNYHKVFYFPNFYGASVVCNPHSYGAENGYFEVAVIYGLPNDWEIVYDTPIADDIIPNLCFAEVGEILRKIEKLPPRVAKPTEKVEQ